MYIGYAERYVSSYEVHREKKIGRNRKIVLLIVLAFLLGLAVMHLRILHGTGKAVAVESKSESITEVEAESDEGTNNFLYVEETVHSDTGISTEMQEVMGTGTTEVPDTNLVIIDAGHGGEDEGCTGNDILEKDINLTLALALRDKLEERGFEVLLTREDDSYLTLEERVEIANASKGDFLISIHQNAYEENRINGIETWYNGQTACGEESKRLAQLVQQRLILYTEGMDRGIVENEELVVIRETAMPSCLVETGFITNGEECAKLTDPAYQMQIVEGLAAAVELYFFPRTMYLTFDDGPSAEHTDRILDTLKEREIKATFFVIGENVRKHPELAKRIVEEGHTIGIHCNWHDYDTLYESVESYVADFEQAYQTVYEVTGVECQLFRFPGGSINSFNKKVYRDIVEEMTERGYVYFDWNASLEDAVGKNTPEQLIDNAKQSTLGRKKIVMLAHDTVYNTALCLEELLEQFPEYCFEPLAADVEPIQF